jgi:hypothetical protein
VKRKRWVGVGLPKHLPWTQFLYSWLSDVECVSWW